MVSGGVYGPKKIIPHTLESFQRLNGCFLVFLILFGDLDVVPPVAIIYLIILCFFKMFLTRGGRDGSNSAEFCLIIYRQLLTGDIGVG